MHCRSPGVCFCELLLGQNLKNPRCVSDRTKSPCVFLQNLTCIVLYSKIQIQELQPQLKGEVLFFSLTLFVSSKN